MHFSFSLLIALSVDFVLDMSIMFFFIIITKISLCVCKAFGTNEMLQYTNTKQEDNNNEQINQRRKNLLRNCERSRT